MNKKAEEIAKELIKEASNAVGSVNWSKQKHIPVSNYKVRDANLKEKVMYGVGAGAKKGVKAAKQGVKLIKTNPAAKATAGVLLGSQAVAHTMKKVNDKSREKDTKTKMVRDRLAPETIQDMKLAPLRTAVLASGAVAGTKGEQLGRKLAAKAVLKKGINNIDNAKRMVKNIHSAGHVGGLLGVGSAVLVGSELERKVKQRAAVKKLDKLSQKHLGRPATEKEKAKIKNSYKAFGYKPDTITPESEIQNRRRAKEKSINKKASEALDALVKEASSNPKWSKEDKKGYAKNVAINVAQDFMNAGNPLNIGSSIVGSLADAAILERSSLNLNKKLKAEQVSKEKVDNFNKTVGLKNGTTAISSLKKKI